jgi:hypothetical protein
VPRNVPGCRGLPGHGCWDKARDRLIILGDDYLIAWRHVMDEVGEPRLCFLN